MPPPAHGRTLQIADFGETETHRLPHPCPSLGKGWDQPTGAHGTIAAQLSRMSLRQIFHSLLLLPAVLCLATLHSSADQSRPSSSNAVATSTPTSDRLHQPGWWPTKIDAPRSAYAGTAACTKCHKSIAESYKDMAMSQASVVPADSDLLRKHADLHFQLGPYKYSMTTTAAKSRTPSPTVSKRPRSDLEWAFGAGSLGQTYVFRRGDNFYESQVSYYSGIEVLDITTGQSRDIPETLEAAAGRHMYGPATTRCFACHTTASFNSGKFEPAGLDNGVTCEACHGPAANHVAAEKAGMDEAAGALLNPGKLDRANAVDFCGACHRTTGDVIETRMGRYRRDECALSALSAAKEPLLGTWRRSLNLHLVPRSAQAAGKRRRSLRLCLPAMPRRQGRNGNG